MNEFYNKLILKDEEYKNGLFPQIPNYRKQGSAYILIDGINDNILVDEHTTTKEIRQGKYKRLVEISTSPYMEEIRFKSASKETSFTFDIYVKAVIQVKDPIVFYNNKNLDVTSYFTNMFSLDVRKITRKYSILDYDHMDEELTEQLSSYNNVDISSGFEYRISVVDAEPGEESIEYVKQSNKQNLNIELKSKARKLIGSVAVDYEEAVRTEIVEGKLTEEEGLLKIQQFKLADYEGKRKQISELRSDGLISDTNARDMIKKILFIEEPAKLPERNQREIENSDLQNDIVLDELYDEE